LRNEVFREAKWWGKMGAVQKLFDLEKVDKKFEPIINAVGGVLLDKEREIRLVLTCFLSRGHLLIEDLPGMGKTTVAKAVGQSLGLIFSRVQFTNDLLPADILGTNIFDPQTKEFRFLAGPIFGELVLGDELNRATPKTQSALLEAMEERKVTIDGKTFDLPNPFFLVATQNPEHQIGTYPLPESQLDRFMMRLRIGYPTAKAERQMLKTNARDRNQTLKAFFSRAELENIMNAASKVHTSDHIIDYTQMILAKSREMNAAFSPRAGLLTLDAAKAWAYISGRDFVLPEDVKAVAASCLNHRIAVTHQDAWQIVNDIVDQVPVPK
jgi:MoxR-like ATPase